MILLEDFQSWISLELPVAPQSLFECLIGKGSRIIFLILALAGLRVSFKETSCVSILKCVLSPVSKDANWSRTRPKAHSVAYSVLQTAENRDRNTVGSTARGYMPRGGYGED